MTKPAHTPGPTEPTPENIAARLTDKLFAGRSGHGGAKVSYLQMRPDDLRSVIEEAIKLYAALAKAERLS